MWSVRGIIFVRLWAAKLNWTELPTWIELRRPELNCIEIVFSLALALRDLNLIKKACLTATAQLVPWGKWLRGKLLSPSFSRRRLNPTEQISTTSNKSCEMCKDILGWPTQQNDNAFNSSHACPILEDVYQSLDCTRLQPLPRTAASA